MSGSSPHTRGALVATSRRRLQCRIIPAYAGSTSTPTAPAPQEQDHPRIRGEHYGHLSVLRDNVGSSPHTRGARDDLLGDGFAAGIIPAYAGSTALARRRSSGRRDHPRIRGEHRADRLDRDGLGGSSPHTRGARYLKVGVDPVKRIIPAYAGSTVTPSTGSVTNTDHPRIRGEHVLQYVPTVGLLGSSPHTRGAHRQRRLDHQPVWIIPAYAGSTGRRRRRCRGRRDHPRIRGEHFSFLSQWCGSGGIIPAYAGSTPARRPHRTASADHPRIRGEHWAPSTHRPKP